MTAANPRIHPGDCESFHNQYARFPIQGQTGFWFLRKVCPLARTNKAVMIRMRLLLVVLLLMPEGIAYANRPPGPLEIVGTVRDPYGTPVEGVVISDGGTPVFTDASGFYSLQETNFGTYTLTASRSGIHGEYKSTNLTILSPSAVVDFDLKYVSRLTITPVYVSVRNGPSSVGLTLRTYTPHPGPAGQPSTSCAYAQDSLSGATIQLAHVGFIGSEVIWKGTIAVPAGSDEDYHQIATRVRDCASGVALDWGSSATFAIDNTPPQIVSSFPEAGNAQTPIGIEVRDPLRSVTVSIDGGPAQSAVRQNANPDGLTPWSVLAPDLIDGPHVAEATATDSAGNTSTVQFAFVTENVRPSVENPYPTGVVSSSTPLIGAHVSDASGIVDWEMTISNGVISQRVPATYNPDSGVVEYQVPDGLEEPALGRFPLPPGFYTATLSVRDAANNYSGRAWYFTVLAGTGS